MSAAAGVIDLAIWQLALALVLVAAVIVVSIRQSLGLGRDLVIGSVRTIVQLYAVGTGRRSSSARLSRRSGCS